MTRTRPNERLERLAWIVSHQTAVLVTHALEHIGDELRTVDGYGARGGDGVNVSGGGPRIMVRADDDTPHDELFPVTGVEAAMFARHALTSTREQIRDDIDALETMVRDLNAMLQRTLGDRVPRSIVTLCDAKAKGYDGHQLAWVRYSRDPNNGWADATCREAAGRSGLCPACLVRANRWRGVHGLTLLSDAPPSENADNVRQVA